MGQWTNYVTFDQIMATFGVPAYPPAGDWTVQQAWSRSAGEAINNYRGQADGELQQTQDAAVAELDRRSAAGRAAPPTPPTYGYVPPTPAYKAPTPTSRKYAGIR